MYKFDKKTRGKQSSYFIVARFQNRLQQQKLSQIAYYFFNLLAMSCRVFILNLQGKY